MGWILNQHFISQYNTQVGYVYDQINGARNQKVFLDTSVSIVRTCEAYESLHFSRIFLETQLKRNEFESNGWITYHKDMKKLAYSIALDIVRCTLRKNGL